MSARRPVTELDRTTHRALVEAGYAPLDEYVARWASITPKGTPPMHYEDPRALPEWLQREADEAAERAMRDRARFLSVLLALVALVSVVALTAVPAIGDWIERNGERAWEANR